jgi:ATP-dependent HslUV protease ATP-binding subunit HslU
VGREVDSIIRDLADIAIKDQRDAEIKKVQVRAEDAAEDRVLDILLPPARDIGFTSEGDPKTDGAARQRFRKKLREGDLDDKEIEVDVVAQQAGVEIFGPQGMEELTSQLQGMMKNMGSDKSQARKMTIKEALKVLAEEEAGKLLNEDDLKLNAIQRLENHGIVFIDEIDKIIGGSQGGKSADVSREGVQRDLLPLIEGSTISTKYGMVKTDHILFIGSGAFQLAKPSDLIPEMQGRMPIRVELAALTVEDFTRILTEPDASLTEQYEALLQTEEVSLEFTENGIHRIAELAWQVNESTENIGARRLHTMLERLLETISFEASDRSGDKVTIDQQYVNDHLDELAENEDYARYIL